MDIKLTWVRDPDRLSSTKNEIHFADDFDNGASETRLTWKDEGKSNTKFGAVALAIPVQENPRNRFAIEGDRRPSKKPACESIKNLH